MSGHPELLFIHGLEGHPDGAKVRMLRDQGEGALFAFHDPSDRSSKRRYRYRLLVLLERGELAEEFLALTG